MNYRINLWRVDDAGRWTACAAGHKPDGLATGERDTEAANPPLKLVADWPFNGKPAYHAAEAVLDFMQIADGFPTAAAVDAMPDRPTKKDALTLADAVALLNPVASADGTFNGAAGLFLTVLLSLPRFVDRHGRVEIGSQDVIEVWRRRENGDTEARLERPKVTTSHEAVEAERMRTEWLTKRVAAFTDLVLAVGRQTQANGEARRAVNAINVLVNALSTYGELAHLPTIERKANEAAAALTRLNEAAFEDTAAQSKPRRPKYIPYKQALKILEGLNCPKSRKTLLRWRTGQNTPEGFTPEKMKSVEAFTAWAKIYANREQAKINTNNALRIDNPKNGKMRIFR